MKKDPCPSNQNLVPFPLVLWDFNQCDPYKCSGKKLVRLNIVREWKRNNISSFKGIILTPSGTQAVSPADKDIILKNGLAVVDCSWAQLDAVPFHKLPKHNQRLLPLLFATNPVNYGKPWNLNCAEALAAGCFICNFDSVGRLILSKFKWGPNFYPLNESLFHKYKNCTTSAQICEVQSFEIATLENEKKVRKIASNDTEDYFKTGNQNRALVYSETNSNLSFEYPDSESEVFPKTICAEFEEDKNE